VSAERSTSVAPTRRPAPRSAAAVRVVYLAMKPQLRGRIRRNVQTLLELGADVTVLTVVSNKEFFVGLDHPRLRAEFLEARSVYVRLSQYTSRRSLEQAERRRARAAGVVPARRVSRRVLLSPLLLVGFVLVSIFRVLRGLARYTVQPLVGWLRVAVVAVWRLLPGAVRRTAWRFLRWRVRSRRRNRRFYSKRVQPWLRHQRHVLVRCGDRVRHLGRRLDLVEARPRPRSSTARAAWRRRRVLARRAVLRRRRSTRRALLNRRLKMRRALVRWAKDRLRPWHRVSRFFAFWRESAARAVELAPDLVVSSDLPGLVGAGRVAHRLGLPHLHDCHELYLESTSFRATERRLLAPMERRYLRRADSVVAVNTSIAVEYGRRYGRQPLVVRNCASRLPADLPVRDLRLMAGLPLDAQVVLYQGGFAAGRGLEVCVAAVPGLPVGAHLVLLGFGPMRDDLVNLAELAGVADRVHVVDAVPPEELLACTASATVGLMPYQPVSRNNMLALPNKIFEYTTAGVPVVVSDLPELRRIAVDAGCGQVYDSFDPLMLAAALREVLDPSRYPAYKEAARRFGDTNVWETEREILVEQMVRLAPGLAPDRGHQVSAPEFSATTATHR